MLSSHGSLLPFLILESSILITHPNICTSVSISSVDCPSVLSLWSVHIPSFHPSHFILRFESSIWIVQKHSDFILLFSSLPFRHFESSLSFHHLRSVISSFSSNHFRSVSLHFRRLSFRSVSLLPPSISSVDCPSVPSLCVHFRSLFKKLYSFFPGHG
jgi:hypothetical protein